MRDKNTWKKHYSTTIYFYVYVLEPMFFFLFGTDINGFFLQFFSQNNGFMIKLLNKISQKATKCQVPYTSGYLESIAFPGYSF